MPLLSIHAYLSNAMIGMVFILPPIFPFFQVFGDRPKHTIYNWYHRYSHIPQLILQQRQQRWNNNKHNKLLAHIGGMETRLQKKKNEKRELYYPEFVLVIQGQHISYLLEAK